MAIEPYKIDKIRQSKTANQNQAMELRNDLNNMNPQFNNELDRLNSNAQFKQSRYTAGQNNLSSQIPNSMNQNSNRQAEYGLKRNDMAKQMNSSFKDNGVKTGKYDWADTDYNAILKDSNSSLIDRMKAGQARYEKTDYMQNNDFQKMINDEMAKEHPNTTMVAYWDKMNKQKMSNSDEFANAPKDYNDADYTQDFQGMIDEALKSGNHVKAAQLQQDRQKKIDYLNNTDLKAMADEARASGDTVKASYYEQLRKQKLQNNGVTEENAPGQLTAASAVTGTAPAEPTATSGTESAPTAVAGYSEANPEVSAQSEVSNGTPLEIEGVNSEDYTQDFQALANATDDPEKKQKLQYARDNKVRFLATNDLKALADEARLNGDTAKEDYYNQLHYQKMAMFSNTDFNELITKAVEAGDANMAQAYTDLRNQKLNSFLTDDYAALLSDAVARGDKGEIALYQGLRQQKLNFFATSDFQALADNAKTPEEAAMYDQMRLQKISLYANSDFTALADEARTNGNEPLAKVYEALHEQKQSFMDGNDLEGLAQEAEKAGNPELASLYRGIREQKVNAQGAGGNGSTGGTQTPGTGTGTTPGTGGNTFGTTGDVAQDFNNIMNSMGDPSGNIKNQFGQVSQQVKNAAKYNEDWANSQYEYNKYKAEADAEKGINEMYQRHYQVDLPAFKERIANYGLSAAGGLSRQENLMMQSALMSERNKFETDKNELIMQAKMEANKLIADGRMKEAEQLLQIGIEQVKAILDKQRFNQETALKLAEIYNTNNENQKGRDHESAENQATRDSNKELKIMEGDQAVFLEKVRGEIAEAKSENDLRRRIKELSEEYGFKGDQEELISRLRKEETTHSTNEDIRKEKEMKTK